VVEVAPGTSDLIAKLESIAEEKMIVSGSQIRLRIADRNANYMLSICSMEGLRLVSLNPVHVSLEDYFAGVAGALEKREALSPARTAV
jgi:hypothetical protein